MPVTVNVATKSYVKNSNASDDRFSRITSGTSFSRLSPDIQSLYVKYPFIPYIGSFLSVAEKNINNFTIDGLIKLAEVAGCIKKCLSGIEYEFYNEMNIAQEMYMVQLRSLVFIIEEIALQKSADLNYAPSSNNARIVYVPHEVQEYLETVKTWPLFSHLLLHNEYLPLHNLSDILIIIASNAQIVSK